jgi:protein TonB
MFFAPPEVKSLSRYSEFGSHLQQRHFMLMVAMAILMHVTALIVYSLSPHEQALIIPVRVLNIKFNGGDTAAMDMPRPSTMPGYKPAEVEFEKEPSQAQPQPQHVKTARPVPPLPEKKEAGKAQKPLIAILSQSTETKRKGEGLEEFFMSDRAFSRPKKYIRADAGKGYGNGSGLAGTKEGQEIVSNYEQEISLWMARHKNYPDAAKRQRIQGNAVVRIRINRDGHIVYHAIDASSGNAMIDDAVLAMVHDSDPVPRVPDNYPEGRELEFLIPVSFRLR